MLQLGQSAIRVSGFSEALACEDIAFYNWKQHKSSTKEIDRQKRL
jgi:hypothetical protein